MASKDFLLRLLAEDKISPETKKADSSVKKLGESIKKQMEGLKAAGVAMTAFGVGMAVGLGKMFKEFQEGQKITSQFNTQIKAANIQFGEGVGKVNSWRASVVELTDKLRIYTDDQIEKAIANTITFTGQLGMTEEQMYNLVYAAGILGKEQGNLNESALRISKAMIGEAESAKEMGLILGDAALATTYNAEAHEKQWNQLTLAEKAQVRYNIVMERTAAEMGSYNDFVDSFNGMIMQSARLWDQVRDAMKGLEGPLTAVVKWFNQIQEWFLSLEESTRLWIAKLAGLVAIMATVAGSFLLFLSFLPMLVAGIAAFAGMLTGIIPLFLAIVAGMALLAGAIITHWQEIVEIVSPIVESITDYITERWGYLFESTKTITEKLKAIMFAAFDYVWDVVSNIMTKIVNWTTTHWDDITEAYETAKEIIGTVWDAIVEIVDYSIDLIDTIIQEVVPAIKTFWEEHWDEIYAILEDVWGAIEILVTAGFDVIVFLLTLFKKLFEGDWKGVWEEVKKILKSFWDPEDGSMRELFKKGLAALEKVIEGEKELLKEAMKTLGRVISEAFIEGMKAVLDVDFLKVLGGVLKDLMSWKNTAVKAAFKAGFGIGRALLDGLQSAIADLLDWLFGIPGPLEDITEGFPESDPKKGPLRGLSKQGAAFWTTFLAGMRQTFPIVQSELNDMLSGMSAQLSLAGSVGGGNQYYSSTVYQPQTNSTYSPQFNLNSAITDPASIDRLAELLGPRILQQHLEGVIKPG